MPKRASESYEEYTKRAVGARKALFQDVPNEDLVVPMLDLTSMKEHSEGDIVKAAEKKFASLVPGTHTTTRCRAAVRARCVRSADRHWSSNWSRLDVQRKRRHARPRQTTPAARLRRAGRRRRRTWGRLPTQPRRHPHW
jgi:hypothetical protein